MPTPIKDLTGNRYGRLTALSFAGIVPYGRKGHSGAAWRCRCDCGTEIITPRKSLSEGNTKSCGCYHRDLVTALNTTHGQAGKHTKTGAWMTWQGIKSRCSNPKLKSYKSYGGKGVTVCDRWKNSFENFLADMGERPEGYSIERLDPFGNYEPDNCTWIPLADQWKNKREHYCGGRRGVERESV
jgi:hypothetical protein